MPTGGPLPPLRPKHSAYGVAGLRFGSGYRDSKLTAGSPDPRLETKQVFMNLDETLIGGD